MKQPLLLIALLLSTIAIKLSSSSSSSLSSSGMKFACPVNFPCYCMRTEAAVIENANDDNKATDKHKVHCATSESDGSAFDLTLETGKSLRVQCINSPDWSDFLLGANLRLGSLTNVQYLGCELPGPRYSEIIVRQLNLSVGHVEYLRIDKLRGNVSKADLDVFPQLKRLVLTANTIGDVPVDLLYGLPRLTQLEMRGTQLKLPSEGFFRYSRAIVSLELSQNDLRDLSPGTFDGLERIQLLNMWGCNITQLHPHQFRRLSSLQSLDIKMNQLRALPSDIFHDLVDLRVVNFGFNNFTQLPIDLFARNRRLRIVKLMYNRVNITALPERLLANLTELKVASLERIGLLDVPKNLIWGSDAIVELNMNRNYLTTLPVDFFKDARALHKLSLNFNDLRELPNRLFSRLRKLASLDLSRNHLSMISEHLFVGLDALQELNVQQNDLKFIEVDALSHLASLRVAKFARNRLDLRTDMFDLFGQLSPFYACKSLEELHLAHNNVSEIYADWMVAHVRLRKLDLSYNSLEYIQTEDLQFVSSKLQVDLTHNEIATIDLTQLEFISSQQHNTNGSSSSTREVIVNLNSNPIYCDCQLYSLLRYTNGESAAAALDFVTLQLQHLTCDGPEHMKGARLLTLKASELKCPLSNDHDQQQQSSTESNDNHEDPCAPNGVCECWLRPVDRTLILDCAAKNLTVAPANIVLGNSEHVELDLSGNSLTSTPNLSENGYEMVRLLNLADNRIERIDESLISPNLMILRLEGNELSFIDESILQTIASKTSNLTSLTLHDNPWRCDCEALALLDFVQNNYELLAERHNISCATTNHSLASLQPADLCPYYSLHTIIVASAAAIAFFAVLAIVFAGLFLRYRQQIKVYLYSKNTCMWLVAEEELDKDKVWDAFVSYSHHDEEFVVEELVKKLEDGPKAYKLCIHRRDWLAGDWIPNNILRSVEGSRRTIIVLSRHFIDSEWGKLEFQAAHKKALNDKCARLIVVLYGDIEPSEIADSDLRDYLKMNTYVKWGDPWFYQKLRYALPHKQYTTQTKDLQSDADKLHDNDSSSLSRAVVIA